VGDDRCITRIARHRDRVERFGDGADLIELDEERVADGIGDAAPQDLGVRDEHVVPDELDAVSERPGQRLPAFPVALREPVLDRDDWVLA
jgi:hypothetical protein